MIKRGRKSAASIIDGRGTALSIEKRLLAPVTLNDAARDVWKNIVNDLPSSFFSPAHIDLLTCYCSHVVTSNLLNEEIHNFDSAWLADDDGLKRYDKLLAMRERENRQISSLGTRLSITPQSVDRKTRGTALNNQSSARKPWELNAIEKD